MSPAHPGSGVRGPGSGPPGPARPPPGECRGDAGGAGGMAGGAAAGARRGDGERAAPARRRARRGRLWGVGALLEATRRRCGRSTASTPRPEPRRSPPRRSGSRRTRCAPSGSRAAPPTSPPSPCGWPATAPREAGRASVVLGSHDHPRGLLATGPRSRRPHLRTRARRDRGAAGRRRCRRAVARDVQHGARGAPGGCGRGDDRPRRGGVVHLHRRGPPAVRRGRGRRRPCRRAAGRGRGRRQLHAAATR